MGHRLIAIDPAHVRLSRAWIYPISTACAYNSAWSCRRARNSRDFTVPTGICSVSDLPVRHSFYIAQGEHFPEVGRQRIDGLEHLGIHDLGEEGAFRIALLH